MTFDIDANGILNVSAKDKDTGAEQRITISESSNLDKSEIERMVSDAERNRQEDANLRQLVDARNELDATVHLVERRLSELGAGAPVHEKARAEMLMTDAQQALKEEAPLDRIRSLTSELQSAYQGLTAQAPPGPGAGSDTPSGRGDDDVIDAEFTPS